MAKKILVVDDEKDIVELLQFHLTRDGYDVLVARDGAEALRLARMIPDLILLDVMLPQMDGYEVIKRLKKERETWDIPVILLTARNNEADEVVGLELGADDYIIKNASISRIVARVRNVLRRKESSEQPKQQTDTIVLGEVEIDIKQYLIRVEGKPLHLPKKEFEAFLFIARRRGNVVTRSEMLASVWGSDVHVIQRTVDVHIRGIREKLGRHAKLIETIKGVGYRLRMEQNGSATNS